MTYKQKLVQKLNENKNKLNMPKDPKTDLEYKAIVFLISAGKASKIILLIKFVNNILLISTWLLTLLAWANIRLRQV